MTDHYETIQQKLIAHIRALAEDIGPRGPTLPEEQQAAQYAYDQLKAQGYQPKTETFKSATSIYHPHMITALLLLIAFLIYPLGGRITAAIAAGLSLLALVSDILELGFINNPLRMVIPKGTSQNVLATLDPEDEHRQDLILVGHLDSHQTGIIFSSNKWVAFFQAFTTIGFVTFSAQVVFFMIGIVTQWGWLWYASIPSAISAVILFAICWEANRAPFSPGANDNASAVAMVLTLAETLKNQPLQHTRVWFVLTGCEEVQHYGMIDFLNRHKNAFVNPKVLVFEMVGVAGPAWETKEGIIVPFKPDQGLVQIVENIAKAHPDLGAYPSFINGGNSEMADARRAGLPAICFFGLTPEGQAPFWHQTADTADKIDPDVIGRTYAFTRNFISLIDQQS